MRWREIDLRAIAWTVPPERFKTEQYHQVPLTADAIAILENPLAHHQLLAPRQHHLQTLRTLPA